VAVAVALRAPNSHSDLIVKIVRQSDEMIQHHHFSRDSQILYQIRRNFEFPPI
jgi:hypothetical protein